MEATSTRQGERLSRILIVDDHPATREGLAMRIKPQPDLVVCGEAVDVEDALAKAESTHPDLAVIDICLKSGNGLELIKRLKLRGDPVRMLAWSMHDETLYAERALHAGAQGYVDKSQSTDTIVDAIRSVLDGNLYLSGRLANRLLRQSVHGTCPEDRSSVNSLSDRELEVLRYMGEGLSTREVSVRMNVTSKTVDTYRSRIKDKLDLRSGIDLMRFAVQWVLNGG